MYVVAVSSWLSNEYSITNLLVLHIIVNHSEKFPKLDIYYSYYWTNCTYWRRYVSENDLGTVATTCDLLFQCSRYCDKYQYHLAYAYTQSPRRDCLPWQRERWPHNTGYITLIHFLVAKPSIRRHHIIFTVQRHWRRFSFKRETLLWDGWPYTLHLGVIVVPFFV